MSSTRISGVWNSFQTDSTFFGPTLRVFLSSSLSACASRFSVCRSGCGAPDDELGEERLGVVRVEQPREGQRANDALLDGLDVVVALGVADRAVLLDEVRRLCVATRQTRVPDLSTVMRTTGSANARTLISVRTSSSGVGTSTTSSRTVCSQSAFRAVGKTRSVRYVRSVA